MQREQREHDYYTWQYSTWLRLVQGCTGLSVSKTGDCLLYGHKKLVPASGLGGECYTVSSTKTKGDHIPGFFYFGNSETWTLTSRILEFESGVSNPNYSKKKQEPWIMTPESQTKKEKLRI